MEEVESPLEEIPSMVKLDTTQLREVVPLIFGAKCIVDSSCREDCSRTNGPGDELVVLVGHRIKNGRIESGHEMGRVGRAGGISVGFIPTLGSSE